MTLNSEATHRQLCRRRADNNEVLLFGEDLAAGSGKSVSRLLLADETVTIVVPFFGMGLSMEPWRTVSEPELSIITMYRGLRESVPNAEGFNVIDEEQA